MGIYRICPVFSRKILEIYYRPPVFLFCYCNARLAAAFFFQLNHLSPSILLKISSR